MSVQNVKNIFWPAMVANWTVWPIITFANLKFVPVLYQVIVVNFCALFWNLYLAKKNLESRELLQKMKDEESKKLAI